VQKSSLGSKLGKHIYPIVPRDFYISEIMLPSAAPLCGESQGIYDPLDPTEKSLVAAEQFATEWLKNLSSWSLDLHKVEHTLLLPSP
jgi:hypothetical protein